MSSNKQDKLKILFSLCGGRDKASSRVRGFWIAEELRRLDFHCSLHWEHSKLQLIRFAGAISKHDIVIFQKTYSRYHVWLMSLAKYFKKRIYLDLDDAPSRTGSTVTLRNVESMMRMADGVFAGNQNLCDYAGRHQPNTHLIPSGIELKHYRMVERQDDERPVCLGWIGNGAQYKEDLVGILEGPLRSLAARYPIRFKLVGACGEKELHTTFSAIPGLEFEFKDTIKWSDPDAVSNAVQDFDIGLYPLLPNDFNKFKCGFKALEYMATGIPVVSSPVAVNAEIISHGEDGFLADAPEEWEKTLGQLIENKRLRMKMGQAGRRKIEESFNVSVIAEHLKRILEQDHRVNLPEISQ